MHKFRSELEIIGVNPFVSVPKKILKEIFRQAGKDKGRIPVHGLVNNKPYKQILVKYSGAWRLYINTSMLKNSPKRIGEKISVTISFDPADRTISPHPKLVKALKENPEAKKTFNRLSPSRQKEIVRYISFLKTEESVERNVKRVCKFLTGNGRFVGRDQP